MTDKKGLNSTAAAAIGAVVGAAAGAAAVALSDEKNREKVLKKLDEYKKELGPDKFKKLTEQGSKALDQFMQKVDALRSKQPKEVSKKKK